MKTTIKRQKLLAKYHILCQQMGMTDDDRRGQLENCYGVNSSRQLSDKQLVDIIDTLQQVVQSDANIWRRRVMAAIGAYLRRMNYTENADIIKAIACRAARTNNYNKIPISKLRAIYNEFSKQNLTGEICQNLKAIIENELSTLN
jgi:hypothetical protein